MVTIRRWYIFLVAAVSLNVVAWAAISLARALLTGNTNLLAAAFQLAVMLVGVPVFLVHWLWAQRLAHGASSERSATLRQVYLYGLQAGFLAPLLVSAYDLVLGLLLLAQGQPANLAFGPSRTELITRDVVAMFVLALLWLYHWRVARADQAVVGADLDRTVRRLYLLGFSAAGYLVVALAAIHLLRWVLYQANAPAPIGEAGLTDFNAGVASLLVGVPLWLIFWTIAQRAFRGADPDEARSALRKLYLYAIVLDAVLAVVTNLAIILAGLIRRLLSLPSLGDLREPLPIILILTVAWAYHAWVLRADEAAAAEEPPRAASVRRLYRYLVAAVGLAAALVGLGGLVGVVINAVFTRSFRSDLAEGFAWYTASLIAGLPVWVLPWRRAQAEAAAEGLGGRDERRSSVRKLFLYFFLFAATMTFLASAVYILYTLLGSLLGSSVDDPLIRLTTAVAYCLISVGVWLYHGGAVRADGRRGQSEVAQRLASLKVAVADVGDGSFGRSVRDTLKRELPGLPVETFGLTPGAAAALGPANGDGRSFALGQADLIVGPWTIAAPAAGGVLPETSQAIAASAARKLLCPVRIEGWQWAGVDAADAATYAVQTARAVRQVVHGEEIRGPRPLSAGAVFAIALGAVVVLVLVVAGLVWISFSGAF